MYAIDSLHVADIFSNRPEALWYEWCLASWELGMSTLSMNLPENFSSIYTPPCACMHRMQAYTSIYKRNFSIAILLPKSPFSIFPLYFVRYSFERKGSSVQKMKRANPSRT